MLPESDKKLKMPKPKLNRSALRLNKPSKIEFASKRRELGLRKKKLAVKRNVSKPKESPKKNDFTKRQNLKESLTSKRWKESVSRKKPSELKRNVLHMKKR